MLVKLAHARITPYSSSWPTPAQTRAPPQPGFFDHIIINDDVDRAYGALKAFIFYGLKQ